MEDVNLNVWLYLQSYSTRIFFHKKECGRRNFEFWILNFEFIPPIAILIHEFFKSNN